MKLQGSPDIASEEVPLSTLCNFLDLTPRRVQQLVADGILQRRARGRFALGPSVRAYIAQLRTRAARGDDATEAQRRRLVKARADAAEMDLEIRKGKVIPVEHVTAAWSAIVSEVRTRLLAIPSRVIPRITPSMRPREVGELVRTEIDNALEAISSAVLEPSDDDTTNLNQERN